MRITETIKFVVNWPGQRLLLGILAAGVVLLLAAGMLALSGRFKWVVRGLALVGCLGLMLPAAVVRQQEITERQSETVTLTRSRYPESIRIRATWLLIGVPGIALIATVTSWAARKQRLRAQVPRRLKQGHKFSIEGNYAQALAEYSQAIEVAPHLSEAYCARGRLYKLMGDQELARADFDRALERDPRHYRSRLERAILRIEAGEIEPALQDINTVFRINDPECLLLRGVCSYRKGDLDNAAADLSRVLKLTNHSDFAEPARQFLKDIQDARGPQSQPARHNGDLQPNGPNPTP